MFRTNSLLTGLTLGAGAMYFFDAAHGARRRKLLADQCNHLLHACQHDFDVAWRDLKNRAQGTAAQARRLVDRGQVPDELVVQRVRAQLGHHVLHPRGIEVQSHEGHVVLRGPVPGSELFGLLRAVGAVPGVRTLTDELTVENREEQESARGRAVSAAPWNFASGAWAPSTKLVVGGTGAFLLANCLTARRRSLTDVVLGTLGFGMLVRSLAPSSQGVANNWQTVEFHKTIMIHAPVEKVFGFLTHPENWLLITNKIRNLRWHGDDAFAKDIALPGMNLYCSERIACIKDNECFVTDSLPDSLLAYHKELHFEPAGEHTRLHLKFNYRPPAGAIGHAAAAIFGLDAKSFFDDFLMRTKNYLETDMQPHDVAKHQNRRHEPVDAGPNVPPHETAPGEHQRPFPHVAEASLLIE
jgi:uncharacterized membrane protein